MATARNIGVLVGSLRKESHTRKLAHALAGLAPSSLKFGIIEIGAMPLYNQDDEEQAPASWVAFRQQVAASDALLFVTPEYNRSIPGALKNAIDVGSRPGGKSVWAGKAGAVVSASPGAIGGFGANHHLRQSLACINVAILPGPEVYLSGIDKLLDGQGGIANDTSREFLTKFMATFAGWVEANHKR